MGDPLFSVVILCYRHFEYIHTAIDSVLNQKYSNIQLIISDDCSDNFPAEELRDYIDLNRTSSGITSFIVRQQKVNSGTVKHLNDASQACSGDYIIFLAGDDALYDENVLSKYVNGFNHAGDNCYIEMAHTGMYDEDLNMLIEYYLSPSIQKSIELTKDNSTPVYQDLIRYGACLPSTSTCFRKQFFKKFGQFDESYALVEDFPMHLRLAKEGWVIHFENFVAIKHRHGGISHGQSGALSKSKRMYANDSVQMISNLLSTDIGVLSENGKKYANDRYVRERDWLLYQVAKSEHNYIKMCALALKHPGYCFTYLCSWVHGNSQHYQRWLLILLIIIAFLGNPLAEMSSLVFGIDVAVGAVVISLITKVLLALCIILYLLDIAYKLINAIQSFPLKYTHII